MSPNYIPKVSVIVPVYNTELYVERAIISLMEQTLDDVQFIIIDDGSKDNSLNIIKQVITRYPARQGQVTLISRENRGVAATRAQGMELAIGDYVIHLDSDDWAEVNWLEAMYTKAIEENADVVVCDYFQMHRDRKILIEQRVFPHSIKSVKQLLLGRISNSNCDKLIKRRVFESNQVTFHSGYDMGEDFLVTFIVLINANKIIHLKKALYYYNRVNDASLTRNYSLKALMDLVEVVRLAEEYMQRNGLDNILQNEMSVFKLNVKALFILHSSNDMNIVEYAFKLYPSTNSLILSSQMKMLKLLYVMRSVGLLHLYPWVLTLRDWMNRPK